MRKKQRNSTKVHPSRRKAWIVTGIVGITVVLGILTVWLTPFGTKLAHISQKEKTTSKILAKAEAVGVIRRINAVLKPHHSQVTIQGDMLVLDGELASQDAVNAVLNLIRVGLQADVLDVLTLSADSTAGLVDLHTVGRQDGNADRPYGTQAAIVLNRIRIAEGAL